MNDLLALSPLFRCTTLSLLMPKYSKFHCHFTDRGICPRYGNENVDFINMHLYSTSESRKILNFKSNYLA